MKKVLALLLGLLISTSLFAFENFSIEFTPETGITNGIINEYVVNKYCKNTNNIESRLDWDVTNLPYIGGTISATLFDSFFLDLQGKFYFPQKSGYMQDYDWLNSVPPLGYASWLQDDPTEMTNYSISTNLLKKFYVFDATLGYNFRLNKITLSPFLMYEYSYIFFDGNDGYKTYKWDNWEQIDFNGKVISYNQILYSGLLGLKFNIDINNFFNSGIKFAFSPKLTGIDCYDYHYTNGQYGNSGHLYHDLVYFNFTFKLQLTETITFNKHNKLGIKFDFDYFPFCSGKDESIEITTTGQIKENSEWKPASIKGGAKRFLFTYSINYTLTL